MSQLILSTNEYAKSLYPLQVVRAI